MTEIEEASKWFEDSSEHCTTRNRCMRCSGVLILQAYREQESRIKELEIELAKVPNLPFQEFPNPLIDENKKLQVRIAALELSLKRISQFSQDEWIRKEANTIIFNSKLGELFQALLEEHNSEVGSDESGEAWEQVEALKKEVGL